MRIALVIVSLLLPLTFVAANSDADLNELSEKQNAIKIHKCCEDNEIMVDDVCRLFETYNQTVWNPKFKNDNGKEVQVKYFDFITGIPDCATTQQRAVFNVRKSEDELILLPNGQLKHVIYHEPSSSSINDEYNANILYSIHESIPLPEEEEPTYFIYVHGQYCMEKALFSNSNQTHEMALVCVPKVEIDWKDTSFLMKKFLNPVFHAIAMILYLLVAIIYFVLPTLRDLAGNMITTINVCLIVSQAADLVRIFTELSNHVSFLITDITLYISLLGAFFWLSSFGFYIWKTFKSRNVFLRVTDVRKYCYYSGFVWCIVATMTILAITTHYLLDLHNSPIKKSFQFTSTILIEYEEQETIGWLGIAVFFTPIAFTILANVFFYVTTLKVIKRINVYGRIHYKLKGCFDLFLQLSLIMSMAWLFLLLSWLNYDGLIYAHIVVNLLQAILVFYVCVARQSHVTFLLRKSCCYAQPVPTGEWGDEMTHMNGGNY